VSQIPAPVVPSLATAITAANPFTGRYIPPKPVHQTLPDLALLPRSLVNSAGQINVIVTIDKTGHVTQARLEAQKRRPAEAMALAAEAAARQWIFEPAVLDGHAVPSEHSIVFQFGGR
jgi:outer membrane biosynthesis protein TonB